MNRTRRGTLGLILSSLETTTIKYTGGQDTGAKHVRIRAFYLNRYILNILSGRIDSRGEGYGSAIPQGQVISCILQGHG